MTHYTSHTALRPTLRPAVTDTSTCVRAVDLTKRFRGRTVVDAATFSIRTGSVTGLIGPNGAGKTTLMGMMLGLVRPSAGSIEVLGHTPAHRDRYLPRVGALIDTPAFHPGVSARANLAAIAALAGQRGDDIDDLLEVVGLADWADDRFGTYSLGMKQRLGIAAALLGDSDLVILDEPANGLDPVGMREIHRVITGIAREGRSVVVSSHLLHELESCCDDLIVVENGRIRYAGGTEDLGLKAAALTIRPTSESELSRLTRLITGVVDAATPADGVVHVPVPAHLDPYALSGQINSSAHDAGIVLTEISGHHHDLQSRYLELVSSTH
ncbi:ABC transporter related protein [Gordonia bronchialis DSM 43247]|uniref:ABC transporter related protein n=1 Tax=Gordonia bronchialis (strain ATCC 25592 / DSM 43247 / BCRC 13721 / JCM 3198 / KCTC 3076 / NBRC 16047 / NCTC 10667) TaxID=526226 RepID=D0L4Q7_GORB4|nr:ATP-binding cassette domain-containing protein [Gordonia bronchialis]ACY23282.1 ABC transporter related protein [Gordonia bronchialis DSM 43247]MCC3321450.1 ATP-binding cassette domain-containing protein [Gordonia bronchialis]QGS23328.1 ATP-binding cassette domain-containing protein [Gordonia bronchialis]STQ66253.1 Fluoroquinolones export ATP-binding protein Rv2688c/MT2762 [Gordonia bronchialis]